jgi:hypothetical protein
MFSARVCDGQSVPGHSKDGDSDHGSGVQARDHQLLNLRIEKSTVTGWTKTDFKQLVVLCGQAGCSDVGCDQQYPTSKLRGWARCIAVFAHQMWSDRMQQ